MRWEEELKGITLYQLKPHVLTPHTHIPQGHLKGAQDASYIYEELIDKYGGSPLLLNGLAVAKMQQGLFEEAETFLQQALLKVKNYQII